jgi:hypothetical protein
LVALLVKVNKPAVVRVAPVLIISLPLKLIALPLNVLFAFTIISPVPAIPLPLLVILPFTVAVMPVVVNATPLLMVNVLQVKLAGAVLLAMIASTVDVGEPLDQVIPFRW